MKYKYSFFRHLKMNFTVRAVKRALKEKGMTQYRLAKDIGYDRSNVSKMLKGKRPIPLYKFPVICKALDVRPEYLLDAYTQDIRRSMYKYFKDIEKKKIGESDV